ncbi:hypothetical protein E4U55_003211 [Claviceps digitariae]|nr:hypothetical protein E4U55_003211 [Claviceps digitariae]
MHVKSLLLASALALASSVVAEQAEFPRIYVPRQIKRDFSNTTMTRHTSSTSHDGPTPTKAPTTTTTTTTKKGLLSDLLSSILGSPATTSKTSSTHGIHTPASASGSSTPGSRLPKVAIHPTSSESASRSNPPATPTHTSSDPAIVIGPTGIVSSSSHTSSTKSQHSTSGGSAIKSASEGPKITPIDATPTGNATTSAKITTTSGGISDPAKSHHTTPLPELSRSSSKTKTSMGSTTPTSSSDGASASRTPIRVKETSSTSGTHSGRISTTGNSTNEPTPVPKKSETTTPTTLPTSLPSGVPTSTESHSDHHHHHHSSSSWLPSITPTQSLPNNSTADHDHSTTSTASGSLTPTPLPKTNETSIISPSLSSTRPHSTGSASISISATDVPTTNGTSTTPIASQSASQSPFPSMSIPIHNSNSTAKSTSASMTNSRPTVTGSHSSHSSHTHHHHHHHSTTTTATAETSKTRPIVTSIRPTATVSDTDWLPPTIVVEATSFTFSAPTKTPTGTMSQPLPTTIPKFISPDVPNKPPPAGTVPIQIGFTFPLNYIFVSSNTVAAAQIFKFLPIALADASGIPVDKLQISELVPYNTQSTWGYVTTLAQLNYPATLVDTLQMDLWSPNSAIYNNPDCIVRNLTALINPNIDIHGNINDSGSGGGSGGDGYNGGGNSGNNNDAFGSGNGGDQSSKQKATTAGIAIAALGFSAMYGAAMFIVARRYKRKRQSHRRSSSMTSSSPQYSEMQYNGGASPALMGGALMSPDVSTTYDAAGTRDSHGSGGHSARTANISAPVATENSLGWN